MFKVPGLLENLQALDVSEFCCSCCSYKQHKKYEVIYYPYPEGQVDKLLIDMTSIQTSQSTRPFWGDH